MKYLILLMLLVVWGCSPDTERLCNDAEHGVIYWERCLNEPNCKVDAWDMGRYSRHKKNVERFCPLAEQVE